LTHAVSLAASSTLTQQLTGMLTQAMRDGFHI